MKLLANENFPYPSVFYLRSKGFDVLSIGMDNASIKDSEVMSIAITEQRLILTFDRDYGELIFLHNYKPDAGVIYLRISKFTPIKPGIIVEELLNSDIEFSRSLTVIDQDGIRQRKY